MQQQRLKRRMGDVALGLVKDQDQDHEREQRQQQQQQQRPAGDGDPRSQGLPSGQRRLGGFEPGFNPMAVHRVVDIFDKPQFYIDGPTANDVRQGRDMGDCWLLAALCTMSNKPGLIERICVAHEQDVGVYGFVFHRDGEWFSEIIDDKLYLTKPDYDDGYLERILFEDRERGADSEQVYKSIYQSNSGALYFAQCENPNETWLPLLEKAFAKAHNDYESIEGGFTGEALEDLTGGVTSELYTSDILDKEYFWKEELLKVNKDFLFGCSTGIWGRGLGERKGIVELHAYSVMKAVEIEGQRLVLLKNPWGKHEWKGPWSDGSKEWTPEWLSRLGHRFGDDGAFWIAYEDLLRKYQAFDRTRIFGPEWKVTSIWTTLSVPWTHEYHDTKFAFAITRPGPVVLVLSQLDDRYFRGLEGQYRFELSFRVHVAGEDEYLVRSQTPYRMNRSVNVELDLEAGDYTVLIRIDAERDTSVLPPEDMVRKLSKSRREKLARIALSYDLAHSKGQIVETEEEKEMRLALEKRSMEKSRRRIKKVLTENRQRHYLQESMRLLDTRKEIAKRKRRNERKKARAEKKEKEKKAAREEKEKKAAEDKEKEREANGGKDKGHGAAASVDEKAVQTGQGGERDGTKDDLDSTNKSKNTPATAASGALATNQTSAEAAQVSEKGAAGSKADEAREDQKPASSSTPATEPETKSPGQGEKVAAVGGIPQSRIPAASEITTAEVEAQMAPQPEVPSAPTPTPAKKPGLGEQTPVPMPGSSSAPTTASAPKPPEDPNTGEQRSSEQPATAAVPGAAPPAVGGSLRDASTQTVDGSSFGERHMHNAPPENAHEAWPPNIFEQVNMAKQNGCPTSPPRPDFAEQHAHLQVPPPVGRRGGPPPEPARRPPWQQQRQGPLPHRHHLTQGRWSRAQSPQPYRRPGAYHGPHHPPLPPFEGSEADGGEENEEVDSDLSSVSSVSDVSDREVELQLEMMRIDGRLPMPSRKRRPSVDGPANPNVFGPSPLQPRPRGPQPPLRQQQQQYPDDAELENDPWNAVAVVGLRVYYKMAEGEAQDANVVTLRVVRPTVMPDDDDSSDSEDEKEEAGARNRWPWNRKKVKIPDVDDNTRDAVLVAANREQGDEREKDGGAGQVGRGEGDDGEDVKEPAKDGIVKDEPAGDKTAKGHA
ncbi:hypothetical protein MAPG_07661 [Magnaporthiopsis poae ATCC 64411]|uniref:Calpain catalytic domain-containing protein n=1 Tax=Magnaporthiopsis poae (strain ATCC 64411 / 73-15) TaxID=644358 RepID=A0A0C4E595_MAGP6|nr:hypothetical protein MAPG_07661 [Magnaporthiopsis poae ATCC 64411]